MLSISAAVEAVSNAVKSVFDFASTAKENQSETEVIKEKRDYKKATDIAEKIIKIAEIYKPDMSFVHRLELSNLIEKFKKYN